MFTSPRIAGESFKRKKRSEEFGTFNLSSNLLSAFYRCLVEIGLPKVKLRTLEKLSWKVSGRNHHQKSMPSKKASATGFAMTPFNETASFVPVFGIIFGYAFLTYHPLQISKATRKQTSATNGDRLQVATSVVTPRASVMLHVLYTHFSVSY